MSLDEAVRRFVEYYSGYLRAREELIEEMLRAGASKKTAHNFVKNLEDGIRLGKKKAERPAKKPKEGKSKPAKKTREAQKEKPEDKPKADAPGGKPNGQAEEEPLVKPSGHPKRYRLVAPGEFEWDAEKGKYVYNLDGKSKVGKYLPLFKFRSTKLGFHDGGEFALMFEGKSGRQKLDEGLALAQARTLIRELEADELEPGEVEVYEEFINGVKSRMRPLAREMFEHLIRSYRAWKNRRGVS